MESKKRGDESVHARTRTIKKGDYKFAMLFEFQITMKNIKTKPQLKALLYDM